MVLLGNSRSLDLESVGPPASTGLLEFAALAPDVGLDVVVGVGVENGGGVSEVGEGSAGLGSAEEDGVGSGGGTEGELVEGDALSSSSEDAGAGGGGEAKGAHGKLGDLHETDIVGNLANNHGNLSILAGHVLGKAREGNGGSVDLTLVEALEDSLAESRVGTAAEERVQLDEETAVRVLGLDLDHGRLVANTATSGFQIDTHISSEKERGKTGEEGGVSKEKAGGMKNVNEERIGD